MMPPRPPVMSTGHASANCVDFITIAAVESEQIRAAAQICAAADMLRCGFAPMSSVNLYTKEISLKIVYYGPGLGGKTIVAAVHPSRHQARRARAAGLAVDGRRSHALLRLSAGEAAQAARLHRARAALHRARAGALQLDAQARAHRRRRHRLRRRFAAAAARGQHRELPATSGTTCASRGCRSSACRTCSSTTSATCPTSCRCRSSTPRSIRTARPPSRPRPPKASACSRRSSRSRRWCCRICDGAASGAPTARSRPRRRSRRRPR